MQLPIEVAMANVNNLKVDSINWMFNVMANDATLMGSTILNQAGTGTTNALGTIFRKRPIDQVKGFKNPRIVIEDISSNPSRLGDNPDGTRINNLEWQISFWVDSSPFDLALKIQDRLGILFDRAQMPLDNGFSSTQVFEATSSPDPDKEKTEGGFVRVRIDTQGG